MAWDIWWSMLGTINQNCLTLGGSPLTLQRWKVVDYSHEFKGSPFETLEAAPHYRGAGAFRAHFRQHLSLNLS